MPADPTKKGSTTGGGYVTGVVHVPMRSADLCEGCRQAWPCAAALMDTLPLRRPTIVTDGGPWAVHDQTCAVCQDRTAILNLNAGHFQPCGECQAEGWRTVQRRRWWRRG